MPLIPGVIHPRKPIPFTAPSATTPAVPPVERAQYGEIKIATWSTDAQVKLGSRLAAAADMELVLHESQHTMPRIGREFDDVCTENGAIHIDRSDSHFLETVWHEIGHMIISDRATREGINWDTPWPKWITVATPTASKHDWRETNESAACAATSALLYVLGAPLDVVEKILEHVSYPSDMSMGDNEDAHEPDDIRYSPNFWLTQLRRYDTGYLTSDEERWLPEIRHLTHKLKHETLYV